MTPTAGCPHCSAPLTGAPACPRCGLRLVGPDAARLWQVDQQLGPLLRERGELVARLLPAAGPASPRSPRSAQDVLLGTGGIALALAALVFAAWTYGALEPVSRCAALVVLALLAGGACAVARRRGLDATAECAAGVALVLGVTALGPARDAGLLGAGRLRPETWWAVGTAGMAVLAGLFARAVPTGVGRLGAVLLGHASVLCLLARDAQGPAPVAVTLAGVALLDVVLARAGLQRLLLAFATGVGAVAVVAAVAADASGGGVPAALAYVVLGGAALLAGGPRATVPGWLLGAAAAQALLGPALGAGGRAATVGVVAVVAALYGDRPPPRPAHRQAALLLVAKAALLAAPWDGTAPGLLAALGLLGGAVAAAALSRRAPAPAQLAALAVLLAGAAAAAPDLPAGDSRALLLGAVGLAAVAGSALLPWATARGSAGAGGAVALAGLWVGLSGHDVELPEAYTGPPALALLAAGLLARRHAAPSQDSPGPGSTAAYGPGLAVLLLPSLLHACADPAGSIARLLALVVLCAGVLLLGASVRLRALVVGGSAGLLAAGLLLLVPYADAVPRWALLACVGVLLTGIGATYEARRRDLDRARAALAALG